MKTATITFHSAYNYGAFLQAYALQHYLIDGIGVENDILNYTPPHMKEHYSIWGKCNSVKSIIKNLLIAPFSFKLKLRQERFKRDIDKYLKKTKEFSDHDYYRKAINNYDLAIAGSDQIWNLESEDFSELFFLPFAKRKISYAASMGSILLHDRAAEYIEFLREFSEISVRENNAAEFVNSLSLPSGKCSICIDPTFLIDSTVYKKIAGNERIENKKYTLYYSINNSPSSMRMASAISNFLKLPIHSVYSRLTSISGKRYGMKVICDAGPCEFLNLIMNAECILTNSFHGTALSIILHKNFWVLGEMENGIPKHDERLSTLLSISGLDDRLIYDQSEISKKKNTDIDWEKVECNLHSSREHSKEFLKKHILGGK